VASEVVKDNMDSTPLPPGVKLGLLNSVVCWMHMGAATCTRPSSKTCAGRRRHGLERQSAADGIVEVAGEI
jgi:hypothetical protein